VSKGGYKIFDQKCGLNKIEFLYWILMFVNPLQTKDSTTNEYEHTKHSPGAFAVLRRS